MTTTKPITLAALLLLVVATGCEVPELDDIDAPSALPTPQATSNETAAEETDEPKKGWEHTEVVDTEPPVTSEPREVTANDPTKGKKSRQAGGYLGAVGHARFHAEHKMIFISIEHALNLYWATEGNYPKTHDEFMTKIIKFNKIQLPKLDEGVEYIYDPEDHKLKIHRPGAEAASEAGMTQLPDEVSQTVKRQIEQALEFYSNSNDAKYPESHEVFMEKIIIAFQIQLPALDEGVEYIYDPEDHKLKIHRPGAASQEDTEPQEK